MTTVSPASCSALPLYTPSPPVPSYSPEPRQDEIRVEQTPRARVHPTGNYIKRRGSDAVILTEQDGTTPTYGRHGSIHGFVTLEDHRETVSEIVLKIKGDMEVMISEGGSRTTRLVDDSYTLWSSHKSHTSVCPGAVPFSVVLPSKYKDGDDISHPLPPTYDIPYLTIPGLFFKTSYILSVTITRVRSRKFQFLSKSRTIPIRFTYNPRMRPWRPIQPSSDFLSDVKIMPEEWKQVVSQMDPRPNQPVDLHLFLPTVEIFGIEDTIPFHVQLTGPVASLREFLPEPGDTLSASKTPIVARLVRQIIVDLDGRKATRQVAIGDAKLLSRPPGAAAGSHDASLDWDGEVRCKSNITAGMFNAGCVRVQDFIVIDLCPRNTEIVEQFSTLRLSHPIKLVTDSWSENYVSREEFR
ncbi:hypothetical protein B0H11DRAFT_2225127 [Mycena galericulata]|nr:hypothetical protein B0H11DRAFT_2225127 [Mycena galericulata]